MILQFQNFSIDQVKEYILHIVTKRGGKKKCENNEIIIITMLKDNPNIIQILRNV